MISRQLRHEWNSCPSQNRHDAEFFRSPRGRGRRMELRALDVSLIYQSLYLVPSKAVWSDLV